MARQVTPPGYPHTGSGMSVAQDGAHPMEEQVVPYTGTQHPSSWDLTGSYTECERGAWQGTGTCHPWRADGYADTHQYKDRG